MASGNRERDGLGRYRDLGADHRGAVCVNHVANDSRLKVLGLSDAAREYKQQDCLEDSDGSLYVNKSRVLHSGAPWKK